MMDDTDRWPVGSWYKFDLCRIRRSAASWPSLLTILLTWIALENGKLGGLAVAAPVERLNLCILQVGDVDPRVDGPIPTYVLLVGTPRSGRLEDLAHWTDGGDLDDAPVDVAHVGGG